MWQTSVAFEPVPLRGGLFLKRRAGVRSKGSYKRSVWAFFGAMGAIMRDNYMAVACHNQFNSRFGPSRGRPCLYVVLVVLIFLATPTFAQRQPFFNLSIESGLVQSQATCLTQDKWGRLWIGTLGGLSCYDGSTFTNFSARDGLPSGTITCLAAAPDGTVWVGTTRGLVRHAGRGFQRVAVPAEPTRLAVEKSGAVWCLAGGKVHLAEGTHGQTLPSFSTPVTAILADREAGLWVAAQGKELQLFRGGKARIRVSISKDANGKAMTVRRLMQTRKGAMLTLGPAGVHSLSAGKFYRLGASPWAPLEAPVTCATEAADGSLWLGARSGVLHIKDTTTHVLRRRAGLSDNLFYDALTDREGHVWLASDGQGLFRFSGAPFETLDESAGLPAEQVMSIAANARGTLYFGTYDGGLFSFKAGRVAAMPFPDGEVPAITALAATRDGTLWVGTRTSGLWQMRQERLRRFTGRTDAPLVASVTVLYEHPRTGDVYVGFAGGIGIWRAGAYTAVPLSGTVQDVVALGPDSVLVAATNGLQILNGGGYVSSYRTGTALDSVVPQCLLRRGPELWVGTPDGGVLCYNTRAHRILAIIDRKAGLHSDFVYNLVADRAGDVWAGTGNGIHRIRTSVDRPPQVEYFGGAYGVSGMESNQRASLMMPDGSLWFGTTAGAVHYKPAAAGGEMIRRAPVSLSIIAVGTGASDSVRRSWYTLPTGPYGIPEGLQLPYRENSLTVRFRAVSLGGPEELLYRYRMDGKRGDWSAWSAEERVTFSALPPGAHRMELECGTDGKRALQKTHFDFEVETPFHKSALFYFLIGAGCIGVGVGMQALAARRRRAGETALEAVRREEQAKVRQRTAEDFHDEVGNTITRMTVLTSVLQSKVKEPEAVRIIEQIRENAGRLYSGTRDILWSLKPGADNLYEILHRIRDFGQDLFGDTDVRFVFTGSDECWREHRLSLDWSRNLTMIFKEAMNNALKYSGAGQLDLVATLSDERELTIQLRDDGKGFDPAESRNGHGLQNMRTRAGRLGGTLNVESAPGAGTTLVLRFNIPQSAG